VSIVVMGNQPTWIYSTLHPPAQHPTDLSLHPLPFLSCLTLTLTRYYCFLHRTTPRSSILTHSLCFSLNACYHSLHLLDA